MNNEKQHSEYKIIETVATPTFDGVSVEAHPEDQLEGGDTPKETLWAKTKLGNNIFIAKVENGVVNPIGQKISEQWCVTTVNESGVCLSSLAGGGIAEGLWIPRLNNYTGLEIEAGDFIDLGYRKDDVIPDFSKYVSIPE